MSEQIIAVLDAFCDKIGIAVDWAQVNIAQYVPELVRRCATYKIADSVALILELSITILILALIATKRHKKALENNYYYDIEHETYCVLNYALFFLIGILFLTFFFIITKEISNIITAIVFPEKVFLDMLTGLMK